MTSLPNSWLRWSTKLLIIKRTEFEDFITCISPISTQLEKIDSVLSQLTIMVAAFLQKSYA